MLRPGLSFDLGSLQAGAGMIGPGSVGGSEAYAGSATVRLPPPGLNFTVIKAAGHGSIGA